MLAGNFGRHGSHARQRVELVEERLAKQRVEEEMMGVDVGHRARQEAARRTKGEARLLLSNVLRKSVCGRNERCAIGARDLLAPVIEEERGAGATIGGLEVELVETNPRLPLEK